MKLEVMEEYSRYTIVTTQVLCAFSSLQQVIVTGDITISSDVKVKYISSEFLMLEDKCVVIVTFMIPVNTISVHHQFRRILNSTMKKLWSLVLKTSIMTFQLLKDSPDHV